MKLKTWHIHFIRVSKIWAIQPYLSFESSFHREFYWTHCDFHTTLRHSRKHHHIHSLGHPMKHVRYLIYYTRKKENKNYGLRSSIHFNTDIFCILCKIRSKWMISCCFGAGFRAYLSLLLPSVWINGCNKTSSEQPRSKQSCLTMNIPWNWNKAQRCFVG